MGGMIEAWRERDAKGKKGKKIELPNSPKATECGFMHCGREHAVSPERERKSSIAHTMQNLPTT